MSETRTMPRVARLQVYELTLRYTQHQDHNVVTGALELLQQLFRTPPPELLQALTTVGGLAQLPAARDQPGGRGRSGSIVELIGESLGRLTPNEPCGHAGCPVGCWSACVCQALCTSAPEDKTHKAGTVPTPQREEPGCGRRGGETSAAPSGLAASEWPFVCREMKTLGEVFPGPVISVTVPGVGSSRLLGRSEFLSAQRSLLAVLTA